MSTTANRNVVSRFNPNATLNLSKPYWLEGTVVEVGSVLTDSEGTPYTRAKLDVNGKSIVAIFKNVSNLNISEDVQGPIQRIYGPTGTPVFEVTVSVQQDRALVLKQLKDRYLRPVVAV